MVYCLNSLHYEDVEIIKGYCNRTLYIDLSSKNIAIKPVSEYMKKTFIGGKGFDLWLMWNSLPKDKIIKWDDPENEICIANGPLGGTSYFPGSGKSIVTTISPLTDIIIDSNVGSYFGPYLKHSGFDALEIQGISDEEVIIYIDGQDNNIEIIALSKVEDDLGEPLSELSHELTQVLHKYFVKEEKYLNKISVVSTGPGSKHSYWGMLNFSFYKKDRDWASYKQAGRGGIGTVFSHKNIRALVIRGPNNIKSINPADVELLKEVGRAYSKEIVQYDPVQNEVRKVGTGYLPIIMTL